MAQRLVADEPTRPPTSEERATSRRHRRIKLVIASFAIVAVVLALPAALPTFMGPVAAQWAPRSQAAGRRPARCDTLVTRKGCELVAVIGRQSEEVAIPSSHPERGLASLVGTLTLPTGPAAPHPGVLIISGSGGTPRDPELRGGLIVQHEPFRLYRALTEQLLSLGFAVLQYDKRTCRRCYPDFEPDLALFRFSHFEDDARDAHRWLAAHERIDAANLVLMGHSQGGSIAARLGGELAGVSAVVMLAGSIFSFQQGLSGQLRRVAELRLGQLDLINGWRLHGAADDFDTCLSQSEAAPDQPQACLHNVTHRAFAEEAERAATTLPTLERLAVPLFALQGQLDRNIDPQSMQIMTDSLARRDAELHVVAGVGHSLVHEADRDAPKLSDEVRRRLQAFLSSVPRRRP